VLSNDGPVPIELRAGESYAQLIPVRYFCGPVLGARDYCFRVERGDGAFGSTEVRLESAAAAATEDDGDGLLLRGD
jgi:hypothetical protein